MATATILPPLAGRRPAIPEGIRVYAIGDVHGRLDLLREVEALIAEDCASAGRRRIVQVMLGDYVDRGPQSRGVIDHLLARDHGRELVALRGNHESYMLDRPDMPANFAHWCRYGGRETLLSYGLDLSAIDDETLETDRVSLSRRALSVLPPDHTAFLAGLGLHWSCGDYLFVHAGIRPGVPLEQQSERDLTWIRHDFLDSPVDFGCVVVHGHTPAEAPEIRDNRIGIDTRAYASGRLTCLVLEGETQRFLASGAGPRP